jgi:predicted Zn-dependent peptidase
VVSHVKYAFAGQLSTADKIAYTASSFIALTGTLSSINAYFALYDKVTSADVKRVAATYFAPTNRTVVTMTAGKAGK